jgi:hypothetical protein
LSTTNFGGHPEVGAVRGDAVIPHIGIPLRSPYVRYAVGETGAAQVIDNQAKVVSWYDNAWATPTAR